MVQICPRCGAPNSSGYRYCSKCGAQLSVTEPQSPDLSAESGENGGFTVRSWDRGQTNDLASESEVSPPRMPSTYRPTGSLQPPSQPSYSGEVMPAADSLAGPGRADLPPNMGERTGQATFVPYTDESVRRLEKQKSNDAWLMPTIYVAAAVLALLIAATLYLLFSKGSAAPDLQIASGGIAPTEVPQYQPASSPSPTARSSSLPVATAVPTVALEPLAPPQEVSMPCVLPAAGATVEQAVIYTLCRSNEVQIKAWRDLDTEALKESGTGFYLQDNVAQVEKYKADRQYAEPALSKLVVVAMKVDSESALVQTAEVWSVTIYSSVDKSVVSKAGPTPYSEVYHLVKQNNKWYVDKIDFITPTKPGS